MEKKLKNRKVDTTALLEHLKRKWKGRSCQMCGTGNWNVQDKVFELAEFPQGSLMVGGPVIPVIPVVCSNCGNTVLVNAILSGAVKVDQFKEEGGKP
jgi:hypothetical protein